jgi:hypothetical protein
VEPVKGEVEQNKVELVPESEPKYPESKPKENQCLEKPKKNNTENDKPKKGRKTKPETQSKQANRRIYSPRKTRKISPDYTPEKRKAKKSVEKGKSLLSFLF